MESELKNTENELKKPESEIKNSDKVVKNDSFFLYMIAGIVVILTLFMVILYV